MNRRRRYQHYHYTCGAKVMTDRCLGVRTDEHGNSATVIQEPPQPLQETCRRVNERVEAFLGREVEGRLKDVQGQVRNSLAVLGEALERYRYVRTGTKEERTHVDDMAMADWTNSP